MKRDWISFLNEAARGFSAGELLMGPLLRLHDQQLRAKQRARFNEEVRSAIDQQREISREVLLAAASMEGPPRNLQMACDVAVPLLRDAVEMSSRGMLPGSAARVIDRAVEDSRFPLPFHRKILVEELCSIFAPLAVREFEDCLARHEYPVPHADEDATERLTAFVEGMMGQGNTQKLRDVMACLWERCESSRILRAAVQFLAR